tara:strand:+ start:14230 stop:14505 length:276 start_codon:yes stop_codon:yes gene_type:complete
MMRRVIQEQLLRNRRGGLALGNPRRWEDTYDGLTVLLDEIEKEGVEAVIAEADDRGAGEVEGTALRKIFVLARRLESDRVEHWISDNQKQE